MSRRLETLSTEQQLKKMGTYSLDKENMGAPRGGIRWLTRRHVQQGIGLF